MDSYHQVEVIEGSESLYIHIGHRYTIRLLNTGIGLISIVLFAITWYTGYGVRKAEFLLIFGFLSIYAFKNAIFGYSDHMEVNLLANTIRNSRKQELKIDSHLEWIRYYDKPPLLTKLLVRTKRFDVHEKVLLSNGNETIDFLPKHQHVVRGRKKCPLYIESRRLLESMIGYKIKVINQSDNKPKSMEQENGLGKEKI